MRIRCYILSLICALFSVYSIAQNQLLLPVKSKGKWGYCDTLGTLQIPLQYELAGLFHQNGLASVRMDGASYLINQKGEVITKDACKDVLILNNELYGCFNGQSWKLHGPYFSATFPYEIKALEPISDNWIFYSTQGAGVMDGDGKILIEPKYDLVSASSAEGYYVLYKDSLMGVADEEGNEIVPVQYLFADFREPGIIVFDSEKKLGIISINGKVKTDTTYTDILTNERQPFVLLYDNDKATAYSIETGKSYTCDTTSFINFFDSKYLMLYLPDGINLLDKNMKLVFKEQYNTIRREPEGFVVSRNNLFGYADSSGNIKHDLKYSFISGFIKNTAISGIGNKKGVIHTSGTVLADAVYDKAEVYSLTAKMYADGKVSTVEFTDDGKILDKTTFTNVMTIKLGGFRDLRKPTQTSDAAIPSVWYFHPETRKWGLNAPNGEILLLPQFDQVERLNEIYTKVAIREQSQITISSMTLVTNYKWGLVNHTTGEILYQPKYADIREDKEEATFIFVDFNLNYYIKSRIDKNLFGPFSWIGKVDGDVRPVAIGGQIIDCGIDTTHKKISTVEEYINNNFSRNIFKRSSWHGNMKGDALLQGTKYYSIWNIKNQTISQNRFGYLSDFTSGYTRFSNDNGYHFGVIDRYEQLVVAPNYQHIEILKSGKTVFFLKYNKRETYGFIRKNGSWAFEKKFPNDGVFHDGMACMGKNDREASIFVDTLGNVKELNNIKRHGIFAEGLIPIKQGRLWYYADRNLDTVLSAKKWNWLGEFYNGLAPVRSTEHDYFYINTEGANAFKGEYQKAMPFNEHGALVNSNGNWGMINTQGEYIIKPKYDKIVYKPADELYYCYNNGNLTLLKPNGEPIFNKKIRYMKNFVNGNTMATLTNDKRVLLRNDGTYVKEPKDMRLHSVQGDFVTIFLPSGKMKLCNTDFDSLDVPRKTTTYKFGQNGIIFAKERGRGWFAMDVNGTILFDVPGTPITGFTEGYAIIRMNDGRKMYINQKGEQCFGTFFFYAEPFKEGYARISTEKGWGIVDISGNFMVMPKYKYIGRFSEGLATVKLESLISISNNKDIPLVDGEYDIVVLEEFGFFRVESADRVGWISRTGRVVWNPAN